MKLEKWALVAEIVSGFAVVLTLVILVLGVRENTTTLRATAAAISRDSLASLNDQGIALTQDKLALIERVRDPTTSLEDLTYAERLWLQLFQRAFLQRVEAQYFRYVNGMLDDDIWQTVRFRGWRNITASTVNQELWREDRISVYTPGFVEEIESYQPPDEPGD